MVITRTQAKAAFEHVLDKILFTDGSEDVKGALVRKGIVDIIQLLSMDNSTFQGLVYHHPTVSKLTLPFRKGDVAMLKCFQAFVQYRVAAGKPINDNEWITLNQNEFDLFRINPSNWLRITSAAPSASSNINGIAKDSLVELFRRNIKRNSFLFPILMNENDNVSWHRSFELQAKAQDVYDVLDATYTPMTEEESDLFVEQQKYVYNVLESTVLTDSGKSLVKEHEGDLDAQSVYQKLCYHHVQNTKVFVESPTSLLSISLTNEDDSFIVPDLDCTSNACATVIDGEEEDDPPNDANKEEGDPPIKSLILLEFSHHDITTTFPLFKRSIFYDNKEHGEEPGEKVDGVIDDRKKAEYDREEGGDSVINDHSNASECFVDSVNNDMTTSKPPSEPPPPLCSPSTSLSLSTLEYQPVVIKLEYESENEMPSYISKHSANVTSPIVTLMDSYIPATKPLKRMRTSQFYDAYYSSDDDTLVTPPNQRVKKALKDNKMTLNKYTVIAHTDDSCGSVLSFDSNDDIKEDKVERDWV